MKLSEINLVDHDKHDCGWLMCGPEHKPSVYAADVYLAGPMQNCTDAEMNDWRQELVKRMPATTFLDPTRRDYRGVEDANYEAIVEADKEDIDDCQIVVAYCPKPSVGTSMEILYAWQNGQRVIVWAPPGAPVSPWLRYHSHHILNYGFEVEAVIGSLLLEVG